MLEANREVVTEVNTERTEYVIVYRHQSLGQNHILLTVKKYFENVAKSNCFGTTVTCQNYIHD
jgi:hypothetical protein